MKLVKRLSYCQCHKLSADHKPGWFERLLLRFIPHCDIVKTVVAKVGEGIDAEGDEYSDFERQTVLYLRRFYLWRSKWIGKNWGDLYVHHIVRSDDDKGAGAAQHLNFVQHERVVAGGRGKPVPHLDLDTLVLPEHKRTPRRAPLTKSGMAKVWELHNEGHSNRDISAAFHGVVSREGVRRIVNQVKKHYKPTKKR